MHTRRYRDATSQLLQEDGAGWQQRTGLPLPSSRKWPIDDEIEACRLGIPVAELRKLQ